MVVMLNPKFNAPMCNYRPRRAPNPFFERGAADALAALQMTPGYGVSGHHKPAR